MKDVEFELVTSGIRFPVGSGLRFWGWSCTYPDYTLNELSGEVIGCSQICVYMVMGQISESPTTFSCDESPRTPRLVPSDKMPK